MALVGKRVAQIDTKCNGDAFHRLLRYNPYDLCNIAPAHIQGCELHEGEWGAVGSILKWNWLIDGKSQTSKEVVEFVDEENKSITYRVLEAEMIQIYKRIAANIRVDQNGENCLVTWTVEYEKINEDVPDPDAIMDFAYYLTKDIETHHLKDHDDK